MGSLGYGQALPSYAKIVFKNVASQIISKAKKRKEILTVMGYIVYIQMGFHVPLESSLS